MIDKEKFKANLKETIDTIVFVVVAVILIRFFIEIICHTRYNKWISHK